MDLKVPNGGGGGSGGGSGDDDDDDKPRICRYKNTITKRRAKKSIFFQEVNFKISGQGKM